MCARVHSLVLLSYDPVVTLSIGMAITLPSAIPASRYECFTKDANKSDVAATVPGRVIGVDPGRASNVEAL